MQEPPAKPEQIPGLSIKTPGGAEVGASDHGVDSLIHGWEYTLDWSAKNPIPFFAILAIFLIYMVLRFLGRKYDAKQVEDYRDERKKFHRTPPPLPWPPKRD